jgi:hypothetical protein
VISPPRIICFRIWPTGRLLKAVESVHLFHLKNCHGWTILCLVHETSTDRTAFYRECVYGLYRLFYSQLVQPFHNRIHPLSQLLLTFQLQDASFLVLLGRFITTTGKIPVLCVGCNLLQSFVCRISRQIQECPTIH